MVWDRARAYYTPEPRAWSLERLRSHNVVWYLSANLAAFFATFQINAEQSE